MGVLEAREQSIVLYPNPASAAIVVQGGYPMESIEIFDPAGRSIFTTHPAGTNARLNIEALEAGCYFLSVTTNKGNTEILKFLKD